MSVSFKYDAISNRQSKLSESICVYSFGLHFGYLPLKTPAKRKKF